MRFRTRTYALGVGALLVAAAAIVPVPPRGDILPLRANGPRATTHQLMKVRAGTRDPRPGEFWRMDTFPVELEDGRTLTLEPRAAVRRLPGETLEEVRARVWGE